jgi:hypothetical protein
MEVLFWMSKAVDNDEINVVSTVEPVALVGSLKRIAKAKEGSGMRDGYGR